MVECDATGTREGVGRVGPPGDFRWNRLVLEGDPPMAASSPEPRRPRRNDLRDLPLWGVVAFATRAARRATPLFVAAPPEGCDCADPSFVTRAEACARTGGAEPVDPPPDEEELKELASLPFDDVDWSPGTDLEDAPVHAADSAAAAFDAARAATAKSRRAKAATAALAELAMRESLYAARMMPGLLGPAMLRAALDDLAAIREAAAREAWTDATPVDPDRFGPAWPNGAPAGWEEGIGKLRALGPDPALLEAIRTGSDAFAAWRAARPGEPIRLARAKLPGANLAGADLTDADFSRAVLKGADLRGARLVRARFDEADLRGARLDGATIERSSLAETKLDDASFAGATIRSGGGSGFYGVKAKRVSFRGATFHDSELTKCSLAEPDFREARFERSFLEGCSIRKGRFEGARMLDVGLSGSSFAGCVFDGATLRDARGDGVRTKDCSFEGCEVERSAIPKVPKGKGASRGG